MSNVSKGDAVAFRSFAGEIWDAVILAVRQAGYVDVAVSGPGLAEPMELHAIRWSDDPDNILPGARPRRSVCDKPARPLGV